MSDLVHNERIKLSATILNNLAAAFVVAGFVAPVVNGSVGRGYWLAWFFVAGGIHYLAWLILGGLKE